MTRGVDGVSAEQLRSGRLIWWDAAFTRLLLEAVPPATRELADLGCGLGRAAHDLLPALRELRYVGLDIDATRLAEARVELAAYGGRVELVVGDLLALPFADRSLDAVLIVMTLQHVRDPPSALREARRVLRPGGVLIAIEPDNLDQRVYFRGPQPALAAALSELYAAARQSRRPRDLAIGPELPALVEAAGFSEVTFRAHLVQTANRESTAAFVARVRALAETVAGAFEHAGSEPPTARVEAALADFARARPDDEGELGLMSTTVFRVTAVRPT